MFAAISHTNGLNPTLARQREVQGGSREVVAHHIGLVIKVELGQFLQNMQTQRGKREHQPGLKNTSACVPLCVGLYV